MSGFSLPDTVVQQIGKSDSKPKNDDRNLNEIALDLMKDDASEAEDPPALLARKRNLQPSHMIRPMPIPVDQHS